MNQFLTDRVVRKLETLSDERVYQVLDYIEFLESKYAEQKAAPPGAGGGATAAAPPASAPSGTVFPACRSWPTSSSRSASG